MTLREQAVVLHLFSRTAREQGTIFCSPEELMSWFGDVLSSELEDFTARKMQQTFSELEASGHLVLTEVEEVVAWSLPNAVGRNCICGCNCGTEVHGKPLCFVCYAESKDHGPAGHILQRLQMEQETHCEDCGGTLVEVPVLAPVDGALVRSGHRLMCAACRKAVSA